jgi:hypothetical protein
LDGLDNYKASKLDCDAINTRLNGFAAIEHIDQLKNHFLPKIEEFSALIDKYLFDNQNMRECIVRFDQDIAMKSNKSDLIILKNALDDKFISMDMFDELNNKYEEF